MKWQYIWNCKPSNEVSEHLEENMQINHNDGSSDPLLIRTMPKYFNIIDIVGQAKDISMAGLPKLLKVSNSYSDCADIEVQDNHSSKMTSWCKVYNSNSKSKRLTNGEKLKILTIYFNEKLGYSRISQMLMMSYSKVYTIVFFLIFKIWHIFLV